MLNPHLDIEAQRARFQATRRVQIPDALEASLAEDLCRCLEQDVNWTVAYIGDEGSTTMSGEAFHAMGRQEIAAFQANLLARARRGFQFLYNSYMMVTAYKEGRDPGLLLHRVLEYLNSPAFLDPMREITGVTAIRKADAQATCYRPGHFLRHHDDSRQGDQLREVAYVINLTRNWQPDWGGLLHFHDEQGNVIETLTPRFNTLNLFRVPMDHYVSLVAPWAGGNRYAITGWLRSD